MKLACATALAVLLAATPAFADRESNIRQFEVTLRSMGNKGASAETLQFTVANLAATGTDAEDAFSAVMEVLTSPGINPTAATRIALLARDIGAARRGNIVYWTRRLARAISGNVDGMVHFIFEVSPNGMTVAEAGKLHEMARSGNSVAAKNEGVAILERQFAGSYDAMRRSR